MDPILLQKQIKDNAEDLKSYMNDLKIWEFEMKRKESEMNSTESGSQVQPPVRSKINKVSNGKGQIKSKNVQSEHEHKMERDSLNQTGKPRKISGFDYASWDKFDVDKACEELDTDHQSSGNEDEPVTDMEEEKKREEALYEKERGNVFVKSGKWKEAIQCYSRAISCYRHDAIFYANRALCYLKIQELKSAEADCTTALQLDSNYVKAYQRRAMARVGLGQLTEAKVDLQRVLDIEPKNTASKAELLKIEKKLNSKIEQVSIIL
ncbi:RNA polymerase II-associated protein 3 [Blattella germanica]|nr:RNA polymerase II-associated protein 3 [Blattella germanica]